MLRTRNHGISRKSDTVPAPTAHICSLDFEQKVVDGFLHCLFRNVINHRVFTSLAWRNAGGNGVSSQQFDGLAREACWHSMVHACEGESMPCGMTRLELRAQ